MIEIEEKMLTEAYLALSRAQPRDLGAVIGFMLAPLKLLRNDQPITVVDQLDTVDIFADTLKSAIRYGVGTETLERTSPATLQKVAENIAYGILQLEAHRMEEDEK